MKSFEEMFDDIQDREEQRRAMLNRALGRKGKHRHVWFPVGSIVPTTRPLRLGKKYATKMWECPLCGATKYRNRGGTQIIKA